MYTKEVDYRLVGISGAEDSTVPIIEEENKERFIYHDKYFDLINKIFQRNYDNIIFPSDRVMPMSESLGLPRAVIYPSDIKGFDIKLINYKNVY